MKKNAKTAITASTKKSVERPTVKLKVKGVVGEYKRTPEQIARHRDIQQRMSHERPSPEELLARGEAGKPSPIGEFLIAQAVAAALRQARRGKRLSLRALSNLTGIAPAELSRLESGATNPTLRTLHRYAQAVGKELDFTLR